MALRLEEFRKAQDTARAAGSTAFLKPRPVQPIQAPPPPAPPPQLAQANGPPVALTPAVVPPQPQQALVAPPVAPPVDPQQEAAGFLDQLFPGGQPGGGGRAPLIDFKKNPLEAIGLLLSNVSAGLDGRPSPIAALKKQRAERNQQQFEAFGDSMKLLTQANDIAQNASPETRGAMFDQLNDFFKQTSGFDMQPFIATLKEKHGVLLDDVINAASSAPLARLYVTRAGGDLAKAIDMVADPKNREFNEDFLEKEYLPVALDKLEFLSGLIKEKMPDLLLDGLQWSDFLQLNRSIDDPEVQFNEQEIGVLRRKLDSDSEFAASVGIESPAAAEKKLLAEANRGGNLIEAQDKAGNSVFVTIEQIKENPGEFTPAEDFEETTIATPGGPTITTRRGSGSGRRATSRPDPGAKPLPPEAQKTLSGGLVALGLIGQMRKNLGETGLIKGLVSEAGAFLGTNEEAIDFKTARGQLIVQSQSILKGVQSDFDIKNFINTIPKLVLTREANESRMDVSESILTTMMEDAVAYHKFTGFRLAPEVIKNLNAAGIKTNITYDGVGDPFARATAKVAAVMPRAYKFMSADELLEIDTSKMTADQAGEVATAIQRLLKDDGVIRGITPPPGLAPPTGP